MADSSRCWAIALDGGTTNTRARLVDVARGQVVRTARRNIGVRDGVLSGQQGPTLLARALREAIAEVTAAIAGEGPELLVASGMLSSEVGLTTVPHVRAPAGLDELARAAVVRMLPEVSDRPIVIVPGVRTAAEAGPDGWGAADVMRGEECETLGAWQLLAGTAAAADLGRERVAFLWPGSHTKLVEVEPEGRITRSVTTLAGELIQAVGRHTLLAASLPDELPERAEAAAVEAAARLVERDGLGRAAFLVRIAALDGALAAAERASFWVGAVVADDVAHLARHSILQGSSAVWVGGRQPLRDLYAQLLARRHAGPVHVLDDRVAESAAAVAAVAVARRHAEGRVEGPLRGPDLTG
jgi:2-dehydro-3-deoxygalactonokinase